MQFMSSLGGDAGILDVSFRFEPLRLNPNPQKFADNMSVRTGPKTPTEVSL